LRHIVGRRIVGNKTCGELCQQTNVAGTGAKHSLIVGRNGAGTIPAIGASR
jgi:hypothetical protein